MNEQITKEELQLELNTEYAEVGKITIGDFSLQELDVAELTYVNSIMDKIDALDSDKPIVVKKHYWEDKYSIIDGYHRVKNKLEKKEKTISAFVLTDFSIDRKADSLFSFLQTLIGKKITFLDNYLFNVEGKHYRIITNEGCGGCSSGWSDITVFQTFTERPILIETISREGDDDSDKYKLIINGDHIADVDTGWGNGYYGGDFKVHLII